MIVRMMLLVINNDNVDGGNHDGGQCETKIAYLGPGRLMMVMLILFVMIMSLALMMTFQRHTKRLRTSKDECPDADV